MRKTLAIVGFVALISATPALAPKAHADHLWIAGGAGFRIGNLAFSLVLGDVPYGSPAYYWRTTVPIRYPGYDCSDACFIDHGVYYHASSCPLVYHHFHRYGYEPNRVFLRWAPHYRHDYRYDRRYDHRRYDDRRYYGRGSGYQRDYRYDRRDNHRNDRRYDRRQQRGHDPRYDRRQQGHDPRYDRRRGQDHQRYDRHRHDRRRGDGDRDRDGRRRNDRRHDRRNVRPR